MIRPPLGVNHGASSKAPGFEWCCRLPQPTWCGQGSPASFRRPVRRMPPWDHHGYRGWIMLDQTKAWTSRPICGFPVVFSKQWLILIRVCQFSQAIYIFFFLLLFLMLLPLFCFMNNLPTMVAPQPKNGAELPCRRNRKIVWSNT